MPFVQLIGFVSSRKTNEKLQKLRTQKYCDNCEESIVGGEAFAPTDETVVCAECWENIKLGRSLHYIWSLAERREEEQTLMERLKQTHTQTHTQTQPKKQTNAEELADIMSFLGEMKAEGNTVIFAPL
jgi:hypothetical protein